MQQRIGWMVCLVLLCSSAIANAQDAPLTDCDIYAARSDDPQRRVTGVPQEQVDVARAISACTEALARYPGTPRFQFQLGRGYAIAKDYAKALPLYRTAADAPYSAAQNALGNAYRYANGVPKDHAQAVYWYRKAAEQGHPGAQMTLGLIYLNGDGVPKDPAQAAAWSRKAAEQGNSAAQVNLGHAFEKGQGVPKDLAQAAAWYRKAAEQGNAVGLHNLGVCYEHGMGVSKDPVQAAAWYRKAAEQGNRNAQFNLGVFYAQGRGVPKDLEQAGAWYRKAAVQGQSGAQNNLAAMYREGTGIARDYALAFAWFTKAAAGKDPNAPNNLADMRKKRQVPNDPSRVIAEVDAEIAAASSARKAQPLPPPTPVVSSAVTPVQPQLQFSPPPPATVANSAGRRIALLIGNADYLHAPVLANPANDVKAIAASLQAIGFQSVTVKFNLKREEIISALRQFATAADAADWAMVYYSGHGIEFNGINYMIPIDAELHVDRDIDLETVDVGKVLSALEGARKLRLVILDACRDNPFVSQMRRTMATRSIGRGLAQIEPEAGTLVVYAAKHGETALDGDGANSPFAEALIRRIPTANLEIRRLFDIVRDDVMGRTKKKQQPFSYGSLSGSEDYFFVARQ